MTKLYRIFFAFWSLMFFLFAFVQWNDPDPVLWISIYAFAAIMSALASFNKFYMPLLIFGTIAGFLGGLYFFPASVSQWIMQEWQQADLSMKTVKMEEARESFGLFIISLILGIAAYKAWRKNNPRKV